MYIVITIRPRESRQGFRYFPYGEPHRMGKYKQLLQKCFGIDPKRVNLDQPTLIKCTPEQFTSFIVVRHQWGFDNDIKNLDMEILEDVGLVTSWWDRFSKRPDPITTLPAIKHWDAIEQHE